MEEREDGREDLRERTKGGGGKRQRSAGPLVLSSSLFNLGSDSLIWQPVCKYVTTSPRHVYCSFPHPDKLSRCLYSPRWNFRLSRRPRGNARRANGEHGIDHSEAETEREPLMWRGTRGTRQSQGVLVHHSPSRTRSPRHPRVRRLPCLLSSLRPPQASVSASAPTTLMSSLRRLAQTNAAVSASPRAGQASVSVGPTTPVRGSGPSTPRTRLVYPISPVTSPSLSASTPFDWEAARARRPPPYATPKRNSRQSDVGTAGKATPGRRVVRKKSLYDRYVASNSQLVRLVAIPNIPLFECNTPFVQH